jgi:hypothetical protein
MMICASIALAANLAWPLAFGSGHKGLETAAVAREVKPQPKPKFVANAVVAHGDIDLQPKAESCYKRYQREVQQCVGTNNAGCRLGAADQWDMCEVTGFWPK